MKFSHLYILIFLMFSFAVVGQDCGILKYNSFTYNVARKKVLVEFKENQYIEYLQDKKYYIKSTIEWVSDCEYYLIIQEATSPDFPFEKGARLHTIITKVKKNKVYYTSSIFGRTWDGEMTKIKE